MTHFRMRGPDSIWSWLVAFACSVMMFIFVGFGRVYGILFVDMLETFQVDRNMAARPLWVHNSVASCLGFIAGMLGQKYGARQIAVVGGALSSVSAALCFFAPSVAWITLLWGAVSGLGEALCSVAVRAVVSQHFIKYRTSGLGLSLSGGCIGPFAFSLVVEFLLYNYGIHGAFLIIGAITMHTIPIAMIFRKPSWLNGSLEVEHHKADNTNIEMRQHSDLILTKSNNKANFLCHFKDFPDISFLRKNKVLILKIIELETENEEDGILDKSKNRIVELDEILCQVEEFRDKLFPVFGSSSIKSKLNPYKFRKTSKIEGFCRQKSENFVSNPLLDKERSTTIKGNLSTLNIIPKLGYVRNKQIKVFKKIHEESKTNIEKLLKEINKLALFIQIIIDIDREINDEVCDNLKACLNTANDSHPNSFRELLKTLIQLFKKPLFLLLTLNRTIAFIAPNCFYTIVEDYTIDKGFTEGFGKYGIFTMTLGDLIGRLCLGWVTDNGYISLSKYMLLVTTMSGIAMFSLPFIYSFTTLLIILTIIGILQGSVFVQLYSMISNYMEDHEKIIATGCINLIPGLLGFGIPAYIGFFRDTLGSYSYIFYINGTFGLIFGLFWIMSPYLPEFAEKKPMTKHFHL